MNLFSPNISRLLVVLVCCISAFSCNQSRGLPKELYLERGKMAHVDTRKPEIKKEAKQGIDTLAGVDKVTPIIEDLQKKTARTSAKMDSTNATVFDRPQKQTSDEPEDEDDFSNAQRDIDNANVVLAKAMKVELKELESILSFLNPDSLKQIADSIADNKIAAFCKTRGIDSLTKGEADSIALAVRAEVKQMIEQKYKEYSKTLGDIDLINWQRDFVVIQERVLEANRSLKKLALMASSNSYFESSAKTLSEKNEADLKINIGKFFDGMFDSLTNILSPIQNDTIHFSGQLKIYVKGYTDKEGFKHPNIEENNNDTLSKRRADYIMKIIQDIYDEKLKETKFQNITFEKPIQLAHGYGENYPYENQKEVNKANGLKDPKHRTAILRFSFSVTSDKIQVVNAK